MHRRDLSPSTRIITKEVRNRTQSCRTGLYRVLARKDEACITGEACRLGRYQAVVTGQAEQHPASILLDTGASGNFIDQTYAREHRLAQDKLARSSQQVLRFNGQPSSSGKITHKVNALLEVLGSTNKERLGITWLAGADVVLGYDWMQEEGIVMDMGMRAVT